MTTFRTFDSCWCPSPYGCPIHGPQPRERAVPCKACGRHQTFRIDALCESCSDSLVLKA